MSHKKQTNKQTNTSAISRTKFTNGFRLPLLLIYEITLKKQLKTPTPHDCIGLTCISLPYVVLLPRMTGYVQSPLWDGKRAFPTAIDSWATIRLLGHRQAVVQFLNLDFALGACHDQFVELFVGGKSAVHSAGKYCAVLPGVEAYSEDVHVHFFSGAVNRKSKGFRLQFVFRRWILEKVGDDLWNCSVATFKEDYGSFFPCDVKPNCLRGEDEENCPYTNTSECQTGQWWLAGRCYEYVDEPVSTWTKASAECRKRGGALASLNTVGEWKTVRSMLAQRSAGDVYIGLKSSGPLLPPM